MKKTFRKLRILLTAVFLIAAAASSGCSSDAGPANAVGNSAANVLNGGLAAQQGDWVYYANNGIYRIRASGGTGSRVCSKKAGNLNVIGEWIYFINQDDGYSLNKIRTNGTQMTLISANGPFYNLAAAYDRLYYQDAEQQTVRIRTDGTEPEVIGANMTSLNFADGRIYYLNGDDKGSMYAMNPDGSEASKMYDFGCTALIADTGGGWTYFIDKLTGKAAKTQTDGYYYTTIGDDIAGEINCAGEWIFYKNLSDGGKLYKMKADGTEKSRLSDERVSGINLAGKDIYFTIYSKSTTVIYRLRQDGTKLAAVCVVATSPPQARPSVTLRPAPTPTPFRATPRPPTPTPVFRTPLSGFNPYDIPTGDPIAALRPIDLSEAYITEDADYSVSAYVAEDADFYYLIVSDGKGNKTLAQKIVKNVETQINNRAEKLLYPLLNPSGTQLAFYAGIYYRGGGDALPVTIGILYLYDIAAKKITETSVKVPSTPEARQYEWDASGDLLIVKSGQTGGSGLLIGLYDPEKGVTLNLHDNGSKLTEGYASVSPDRKTIIYNSLERIYDDFSGKNIINLVIYNFETGAKKVIFSKFEPLPPANYYPFDLIPFVDDSHVLRVIDSNIVLYDIGSDETKILVKNAVRPVISADRASFRYMSSSRSDPNTYQYDMATGMSKIIGMVGN